LTISGRHRDLFVAADDAKSLQEFGWKVSRRELKEHQGGAEGVVDSMIDVRRES
jgi:hypothetical protein